MINKHIYFRYEELLDGGSLIISDLKNKGNKAEYQVLLLIEKGLKFNDIVKWFSLKYSEKLSNKVSKLISDIIEKDIIVEVNLNDN